MDFLIVEGDRRILVEAKGILSEESEAILPAIKGERSIRQLRELYQMLDGGFEVYYYLILMSPNIEAISLNANNKEYAYWFNGCINKGMKVFVR